MGNVINNMLEASAAILYTRSLQLAPPLLGPAGSLSFDAVRAVNPFGPNPSLSLYTTAFHLYNMASIL